MNKLEFEKISIMSEDIFPMIRLSEQITLYDYPDFLKQRQPNPTEFKSTIMRGQVEVPTYTLDTELSSFQTVKQSYIVKLLKRLRYSKCHRDKVKIRNSLNLCKNAIIMYDTRQYEYYTKKNISYLVSIFS